MALSDVEIRNARPAERPYKLFDGGGLHLAVTPAGGKLWRLKYRVAGKEKLLSLGAYPAMSLRAARKAANDARETLANGSDPALEKRRAKAKAKIGAGNTFAAVAAEYIAKRKADGDRPYALATAVKAEWLRLLKPGGWLGFGGYQPAQKWLKDRKGRTLNWDDVRHYQKIIKILGETDRVMGEIELPIA